jgi:hypothetical protein
MTTTIHRSPDIRAAQLKHRRAADEVAACVIDPDLDPDVVLAADLIIAEEHQLDLEARVLDPSGQGKCCERHCLECGFKSFGRRSTFEASPKCPKCGSSDVRVDEASYPRHTEQTLRVHIERHFGDTGHRDLYREAQAYLRRQRVRRRQRPDWSHCRDRIRAISRARSCRSRSHHAVAKPAAKTAGGDSGDPDPEPSRRTAAIGGVL